jgi:hypothetical protein
MQNITVSIRFRLPTTNTTTDGVYIGARVNATRLCENEDSHGVFLWYYDTVSPAVAVTTTLGGWIVIVGYVIRMRIYYNINILTYIHRIIIHRPTKHRIHCIY